VTEKVVVHYRDGRLVKGFTEGFSGENATFDVVPAQEPPGPPSTVTLADLKAVFFVKDFVGDSAYDEIKAFGSGSYPAGTRMEVALFDGELLVGAVSGYHPEGDGFFLVPADTNSNNLRCFVVAAAVRRASVL
jgi:hypothetical protein